MSCKRNLARTDRSAERRRKRKVPRQSGRVARIRSSAAVGRQWTIWKLIAVGKLGSLCDFNFGIKYYAGKYVSKNENNLDLYQENKLIKK